MSEPNIMSQEYSADEGGQDIDILCPNPECGEIIKGSYLPIFDCPHCGIRICVENDGEVLYHQGPMQNCPECGHNFRGLINDCTQTDFQKFTRKVDNFVQRLFK
jgi:hypothetical protein